MSLLTLEQANGIARQALLYDKRWRIGYTVVVGVTDDEEVRVTVIKSNIEKGSLTWNRIYDNYKGYVLLYTSRDFYENGHATHTPEGLREELYKWANRDIGILLGEEVWYNRKEVNG